jgi:hypothetical protein
VRRHAPSLVAFALTLACLSVFWSHATPHLCYPNYWHPGDSGHGVYTAWQVSIGRVLYRDIFDYRFPLSFFVYGPLLQLGGRSLLFMQALTILPVAISAGLLALAVVRAGGSRVVAALGAPIPALIAFAVWPYPYPAWLAWPLAAGALAVLARSTEDRGALCKAGVLLSLSALVLQAQGVPLAFGITLGLFVAARGRRLRTAVWFAGGGLLALVPFLLYFAVHGALSDLVWHTVTWPTTYYYNGAIRGTGLFAGVREYYERRGLCQVGPLSRLYDLSVLGAAGLPTVGAVAAAFALLRRRADVFLTALALGALFVYLPNLRPAMSDNPHFAFAALVPAAALLVVVGRGPRLGHWIIGALALALVLVYADRARRFGPYRARYLDFDAFAARYWKVEPIVRLTVPGDRVVVLPYGGWEYLLSHRESGIPHTWLFPDYRFVPESEFRRATRVLAERDPALLVFREKAIEEYLFRADPTLPERYFWNGLGWERRGLAHATLPPTYGPLALRQTDNRLEGTLDGKALVGSVRGTRVFLSGAGEQLWLTLREDGVLIGTRNGKPFRAAPAGSSAP